MTKKFRRIILLLAALAIATAAVVFYFYKGLMGNAVAELSSVYIPTGADYAALLDSLGGDGEKLHNVARFDQYARLAELDKNVRPGRYVLKAGMSYREAVQMFKRGLQTPVRMTFNNVRTADRLAGALGRQTEGDSLDFLALFDDRQFTGTYGFEPQTFIAMFIPNTYEVYWNVKPRALCDRMQKEYERFWNEERMAKLAATKLTRLQASILASIVYEETKMSDEMPRVAGVYINRLRIGMPLQADPTVKFAMGDFSIRRVLNRHLTTDSPYNTYMYKGLPPGPICMPSIKALDAVLNYEHHDYLYFCAAPDFSGYHRFARNMAEHGRNARAYSDALNKQGIR